MCLTRCLLSLLLQQEIAMPIKVCKSKRRGLPSAAATEGKENKWKHASNSSSCKVENNCENNVLNGEHAEATCIESNDSVNENKKKESSIVDLRLVKHEIAEQVLEQVVPDTNTVKEGMQLDTFKFLANSEIGGKRAADAFPVSSTKDTSKVLKGALLVNEMKKKCNLQSDDYVAFCKRTVGKKKDKEKQLSLLATEAKYLKYMQAISQFLLDNSETCSESSVEEVRGTLNKLRKLRLSPGIIAKNLADVQLLAKASQWKNNTSVRQRCGNLLRMFGSMFASSSSSRESTSAEFRNLAANLEETKNHVLKNPHWLQLYNDARKILAAHQSQTLVKTEPTGNVEENQSVPVLPFANVEQHGDNGGSAEVTQAVSLRDKSDVSNSVDEMQVQKKPTVYASTLQADASDDVTGFHQNYIASKYCLANKRVFGKVPEPIKVEERNILEPMRKENVPDLTRKENAIGKKREPEPSRKENVPESTRKQNVPEPVRKESVPAPTTNKESLPEPIRIECKTEPPDSTDTVLTKSVLESSKSLSSAKTEGGKGRQLKKAKLGHSNKVFNESLPLSSKPAKKIKVEPMSDTGSSASTKNQRSPRPVRAAAMKAMVVLNVNKHNSTSNNCSLWPNRAATKVKIEPTTNESCENRHNALTANELQTKVKAKCHETVSNVSKVSKRKDSKKRQSASKGSQETKRIKIKAEPIADENYGSMLHTSASIASTKPDSCAISNSVSEVSKSQPKVKALRRKQDRTRHHRPKRTCSMGDASNGSRRSTRCSAKTITIEKIKIESNVDESSKTLQLPFDHYILPSTVGTSADHSCFEVVEPFDETSRILSPSIDVGATLIELCADDMVFKANFISDALNASQQEPSQPGRETGEIVIEVEANVDKNGEIELLDANVEANSIDICADDFCFDFLATLDEIDMECT
jgi:hypothetical protein